MKIYSNPAPEYWENLTLRPKMNQRDLTQTVKSIFDHVISTGDKAVLNYCRQFDYPDQDDLAIPENKIKEAQFQIEPSLRDAIEIAYNNIRKFHESQKEEIKKTETIDGVTCWREMRPIERVGLYIPGGSAPLFSTVLMLGIPAIIAGCREISICTPLDKEGKVHPAILYAVNKVGINKIYGIGGAHAIAAMAVGTQTLPKVNKIFGPGNQYVTSAKMWAQSHFDIAIDMPAGPSEVLIIADHTANLSFLAADLLSQAEHGPDSQVVLLTTCETIFHNIAIEIEKQITNLPRKAIAQAAIENSMIIFFSEMQSCFGFSNLYAPEHLILATSNAHQQIEYIINAGSVFLGNYSCESAGDYASGTNHTLPTSGYAKMYSGVSLDSFVKKITFQHITAKGLTNIGNTIEVMADAEGLVAHKNAVALRLNHIKYLRNNE